MTKIPPPRADTPLNTAASSYFSGLQQQIIAALQEFEPTCQFVSDPWEKATEKLAGRGQTALLRGEVFEKAGVNFSHVTGTFSPVFRPEIPGAVESDGKFFATGISLVVHPANPFVPAVHMNLRRLHTSKAWFGGGADLTPAHPFPKDTAHFHQILENACESAIKGSYSGFKQQCAEYFYLPHRHEERGVGGIFFDYLNDADDSTIQNHFQLVQAVGNAFLNAYLPLVKKHCNRPYSEADKQSQLVKRGRYAEFNLLYDRGTRFGLQSGGNPKAILMSLPPLARW